MPYSGRIIMCDWRAISTQVAKWPDSLRTCFLNVRRKFPLAASISGMTSGIQSVVVFPALVLWYPANLQCANGRYTPASLKSPKHSPNFLSS